MPTPRIIIDGLGDVASNAIWSLTEINTAAQGEPNLSTVVLRDFDVSPYDLITGKRVTMDFGSDASRFFGGYLWKAARRHWFPVGDPTKIQRQWRLQLVDSNILFTRRVVFKKSSPATVGGPMYGPGRLSSPCDETAGIVYDDTAIAELVSNWLDLSIDGIDVSTLVHAVASITYGQVTEPWNAGMTWGDAMKVIAQLPAAIFYLNQWWQLVYADVDVATAPFDLSDRPRADGAQGYREYTIWDDGSQLANDALGWGAGKGVDHMVFKRETDAPSVAEHRLWQDGTTLWNVWCQPTIDKVVHSDLYGSPSSLRGRKDDVVAVDLVTHAQGLYPGQVVRFRSHEYDVDINIPVRSSKITFEAPDVPKYALRLAHVLDRYGFQDAPPKFGSTGGPGGGTTPIPGVPNPSTPGGCVCGITDTFTRTLPSGFGVSDSGIVWDDHFAITGETSVNGSEAVIGPVPGLGSDEEDLSWPTTGTDDVHISGITFNRTSDDQYYLWFLLNGSNAGVYFGWFFFFDGTDYEPFIQFAKSTGGFGPVLRPGPLDFTQPFDIRMQIAPTYFRARIWPTGSSEPSTWDYSDGGSGSPSLGYLRVQSRNFGTTGTCTATIDSLDIAGVNRCTENKFDVFNRTVTSGWGNASSGPAWTVTGSGTGSTSVTPGYGRANLNALVQRFFSVPSPGPWTSPTGFTMSFDFQSSVAPGSGTAGIDISDDDGRLDFFIGIGTADGTVAVTSSATDSAAKLDWSPYTWYSAKLDYAPGGAIRAKVWARGSAEPSTWLVSAVAGVALTSKLTINLVATSSTTELDIANIDFSYTGKPCYQDCSNGAPIDDFERAVASSFGVSSNGETWVEYREGAMSGNLSVDGHNGIWQYVNDDLSLGLPAHLGTPCSVTWTWSLDFNATSGGPEIHFVLWDIGGWTSPHLAFRGYADLFYDSSISSWNFFAVGSSAHSDSPVTIVANHIYKTRLEYDGTTLTATLMDGDGTVLATSAVACTDPGHADIGMWWFPSYTDTSSRKMTIYEIRDDLGCVDISAPAGPPLSGSYCEYLTSEGGVVTTSAPYQPGSTSIRADGTFFAPGTCAQVLANERDYCEADPATGTIQFNDTRSRTVFVCYNIA